MKLFYLVQPRLTNFQWELTTRIRKEKIQKNFFLKDRHVRPRDNWSLTRELSLDTMGLNLDFPGQQMWALRPLLCPQVLGRLQPPEVFLMSTLTRKRESSFFPHFKIAYSARITPVGVQIILTSFGETIWQYFIRAQVSPLTKLSIHFQKYIPEK